MFWIFFGCALGSFLWWVASSKPKGPTQDEINRATARDSAVVTSRLNRDRARALLPEWTSEAIMLVNGRRCLLALSPDAKEIAIYHCPDMRKATPEDDWKVGASDIVSVEHQSTKQTVSRMVEEKEAYLSHKGKSPVGRALVGGALLGPVGAIAGAASGLNKDTKLKQKTVHVRRSIEVEGVPIILVGTRDPRQPLLRIEPPDASRSEEWFYRLRALMAKHTEAA